MKKVAECILVFAVLWFVKVYLPKGIFMTVMLVLFVAGLFKTYRIVKDVYIPIIRMGAEMARNNVGFEDSLKEAVAMLQDKTGGKTK